MLAIAIALAFIGQAQAHYALTKPQVQFLGFVREYNRSYQGAPELLRRFNVFSANLMRIEEHNALEDAGRSTYRMGINQFADLTHEEFKARLHRINSFPRNCTEQPKWVQRTHRADPPPSSFDWREKGAVSGVKDQADCGSCWAFATVASLEGANFLSTGELVEFSEQQLVDCSTEWGNFGCGGGLMDDGFRYVVDNGGICKEDDYKYTGRDGKCKSAKCESAGHASDCVAITSGESSITSSLQKVGPLSVAVNAEAWQFYASGIFSKDCDPQMLDHGVAVVGYGKEDGKDYWIIKNSWSAMWGEKGYIRLLKGTNECGVNEYVSYAVVKDYRGYE